MKILSISINLDKIDKEKIIQGKKGRYYNLDVIVNDKPNDYGKDVSVVEQQTKEQRENKVPRTYLGDGKVVWSNDAKVTSEDTPAYTKANVEKVHKEAASDYTNRNGVTTKDDDDLPFALFALLGMSSLLSMIVV